MAEFMCESYEESHTKWFLQRYVGNSFKIQLILLCKIKETCLIIKIHMWLYSQGEFLYIDVK